MDKALIIFGAFTVAMIAISVANKKAQKDGAFQGDSAWTKGVKLDPIEWMSGNTGLKTSIVPGDLLLYQPSVK